jgi:guanylate kinase
MNEKQKIIVLASGSCGGKDTLARLLEKEHGYNFIVSTTTRPMRPGESEKNPYNFITNKEFKKLIKNNKLIEYREYHTLLNNKPDIWYYGVENDEVDPEKSYVAVLDTVGLREFKSKFPDKVISIYLNATDEKRKQRCIDRGDFDETEWNRRLADDKIRFSDEVIKKEMQYVVNADKPSIEVLIDVVNIIDCHRNTKIQTLLATTWKNVRKLASTLTQL